MTCIMPPPALPPIEEHLDRVVDETNKAACYLASAMAYRLIPRMDERWAESPTQRAFFFMRQGVHMAFLTTLAALVEETNSLRVNLPRLLRRLREPAEYRTIAADLRIDACQMFSGVTGLQAHFDRNIKPLIVHAKRLRDNVVAHHGIITEYPDATYGVLTRLMAEVVELVDAVSELMTGRETNVRINVTEVGYQAAQLWSKGMDGDATVVDPASEEDEEWSGL
jgi:hypothetical protein